MSDAFTVLWTHNTCRALRKAGRVGERPPVAFSGVHSSLPGGRVLALGMRCMRCTSSGARCLW